MKNFALTFLTIFIINPSIAIAADANLAKLESAEVDYQNGNCEKAIETFKAIQDTNLNQTQKDSILFKTSYCQFTLDKYQESELGFKKYLSLHPNEEEAMLKFGQSLLYQNKYKSAEEAVKKINSADFKTDAAIVIARAQIETERFDQAIKTLTSHLESPEAIYWTGIANYRADKDMDAEKNFTSASLKATNDSWVKADATDWLNRIIQEKRKLHVRLTLGLFKDSNIDQSGGSGTIGQGGQGQGGSGGPGVKKPVFTNTNYTTDTGKNIGLDLIHNTYTSRKLNLTSTASFASPFYSKHPTYNQETASLDFNLKAVSSNTLNYGASLKYLDTFYNKKYSQDYLYFTPTTSWSFANNYWLKFSIPIAAYLNNKHINSYGGAADLYYDPTNWASISMGASTTKSKGPNPNIKDYGSGPTLVSGTMFTNYNSTGAYLGLTFYFWETFQLGLTGSTYTTKYVMDTFQGSQSHKARIDKLNSYSLSLYKTFIQNVLSANLSYSHTNNKSDGFPGLSSAGSVTNNTYTRSYTALSLEYYY